MNKVIENTGYKIKVKSNKGGVVFTATRETRAATWNNHTEFGYAGWSSYVIKFKEDSKWHDVTGNGFPVKFSYKKDIIEFLNSKSIFSDACLELKGVLV